MHVKVGPPGVGGKHIREEDVPTGMWGKEGKESPCNK